MKILGSCQRAEKAEEHKGDGKINCSWCPWNNLQGLRKKTGGIDDQRKNKDHSTKIS